MLDLLPLRGTLTQADELSPDCDTCPDGFAVADLSNYRICAACYGWLALRITLKMSKRVHLVKRGPRRKAA